MLLDLLVNLQVMNGFARLGVRGEACWQYRLGSRRQQQAFQRTERHLFWRGLENIIFKETMENNVLLFPRNIYPDIHVPFPTWKLYILTPPRVF